MVRHDSAPGNTPGGPATSRHDPGDRVGINTDSMAAPDPAPHGRASTIPRVGINTDSMDRPASPPASTPFQPNVIAGFRTPENVAELRELLRLVVDVRTPLLAAPLDDASIEVTFRDGTMALVELFDDADTDLTTYRLTPAEASFVDRLRAIERDVRGIIRNAAEGVADA